MRPEFMDELEECRKRVATLQSSRDILAEEYEDLYNSHQILQVLMQDAENRQDEDAMLILAKTKQCRALDERGATSRLRIQEIEFALADALSGQASSSTLSVISESVSWWKERCRTCYVEKKALECRLSLLSDEACPMLCERMYTHSMRCCGSKICGTCLGKWGVQGGSCPYCRAAPLAAMEVNRPGSALNPIHLD